MSNLLVVIGITGNQGGSVADAFLTDKNWRIRAVTRDPSKSAAQEWAARGVELVRGDMDDVESLITAFTGAHAIFAMTDYWFPLSDPAFRRQAIERNMIPNQLCAELETQRGKNLAKAAAAPQVQKTLNRYVYSSLPDISRLSGGKYTKVWHFDSKAATERWIREDPAMQSSGLSKKSSFIHVGLYTDNWARSAVEIQKDPVTGGYWHLDIDDGHRKQPFIWTRKDTGPLVKKLIEDVEPGTRLLGVSQAASYREFMALWAKTTGRKLAIESGIKRISEKEYRDQIPGDEHFKDHILQCWQFNRDLGYDGSDPDMLYPKDIGAENLLTPLETYFQQEDWSRLPK